MLLPAFPRLYRILPIPAVFAFAIPGISLTSTLSCSPVGSSPGGDGDSNGDGDGDTTPGDGDLGDGDGDTGLGTGGENGSGGAANTGGTSQTGGQPGTGGAAGLAGCAAADILCVDWEDYGAGSEPGGAPWDDSVICYDSNYSRTVTAGSGVNGSQGFVTTGASSSANTCALVHDLGTLSDFWVTAHIKIGGSNPDTEHEVTFFELGKNAAQDDPELRIGYRGDSSCPSGGSAYQGFELGATLGASGGEATGCTGSKVNSGIPVAGEWYCLEVHVTQGADMLTADLHVDGVNQDFLMHSSPVTVVEGGFTAQYLKVGMQSYSGAFQELIIDNLSISTTRVGCTL